MSRRERIERLAERWFFTSMALTNAFSSHRRFLPSLVQTGARRASINLLAAAHGCIFSWLFII
jgi:hypothetical protein